MENTDKNTLQNTRYKGKDSNPKSTIAVLFFPDISRISKKKSYFVTKNEIYEFNYLKWTISTFLCETLCLCGLLKEINIQVSLKYVYMIQVFKHVAMLNIVVFLHESKLK